MADLSPLDAAIRQTGAVVDGISDSQWGDKTLCSEYDVRALLNHLTGAGVMFTTALTGGKAEPESASDHLGDDPKGSFHRAMDSVAKAWRQEGAFEGEVPLPFGSTPAEMAFGICALEIFVHGADLAVATGQESKLDQAACERVLGQAKAMGVDNFRVPGVFGPEVKIGEEAEAHRRMLAYLGRQV